MEAKLEKVLIRLKQQYESYEKELEVINDNEDGMIDISVACALANSIPYLIQQLENQQKEIDEIKTHCIHCDADERTIQPNEILDMINS